MQLNGNLGPEATVKQRPCVLLHDRIDGVPRDNIRRQFAPLRGLSRDEDLVCESLVCDLKGKPMLSIGS